MRTWMPVVAPACRPIGMKTLAPSSGGPAPSGTLRRSKDVVLWSGLHPPLTPRALALTSVPAGRLCS